MRKIAVVAMGAALLASATAFGQVGVGPKPQVSSEKELAFELPFAKVQITKVTDFRLDYPKDVNGQEFRKVMDGKGNETYARYMWLYFKAKVKNPSGKRVLLKDFVGQASIRNTLSPLKTIIKIDKDGNPYESKEFDDLVLGSYRVEAGQMFEINKAEDKVEFVINLGPISNGQTDKINLETRDKMIKVFNIFANGGTRGQYELHLNGKAIPGVLGENGAWVFSEKMDFMWVFDMKEGTSIQFNVKAAEGK